MSLIGHNNGPTMEAGFAWRKHSWTKARADLLPKLPIEILRKRVARAKELGLPYKTYASVRAASGHDVIGFLFSNNALRAMRVGQAVPEPRLRKLRDVKAGKAVLVHAPCDPSAIARHLQAAGVDLATSRPAPYFAAPWAEIARTVLEPVRVAKWPRDGVVVIGDTTDERQWCEAARLAGYIASDHFFAPNP